MLIRHKSVNAAWYDTEFRWRGGGDNCNSDSWTEVGRRMSMSWPGGGGSKRVFVSVEAPRIHPVGTRPSSL